VKNSAAPTALPVRQIEDQLLGAVERGNRLVLTAPTGSGKTTQVPQMLLGAVRGEILVLQPRRLAARLVAQRVAAELGVPLGGLVGYQTRHDSKVSADTRVRFLTEGLFLRRLQSDPQLKGVGAVVLDEFHERSLAADLSLGLVRRLQEGARADLRLLLMSATLDAESLAQWLDCPALTTQGRTYPVDIRYRPSAAGAPPWQTATHALKELLDEEGEGDVLVFMPGAYEIRRTIQTMQDQPGRRTPLVFYPLYSSLPVRQQDAALAQSATRKVIVATNVAETSITIEGIRHVIDSGLARVHRHDPRRGIDALLIENISSAAAEQRAGRAGRTAPGTCTRLWSQEEQHARPARDAPEIQRLDLADALLQLHALRAGNIDAFPWLDAPDADAVGRASLLLRDLGALDSSDVLTPTGQQMAQLPCHPRLGRFLVAAAARDCLERACIWAALIGERDLLEQPLRKEYSQSAAAWPSDLKVREGALQRAEDARFNAAACAGQGINAHAARQIKLTAKLYRDAARRSGLKSDAKAKKGEQDEALGKCLLYAFYDRVAVRRGGGESLLCGASSLIAIAVRVRHRPLSLSKSAS
jgi:ATP-dependent helicase HrpB